MSTRNTINLRTKKLIDYFENGKISAFAIKSGLNPSVISNIIGARQTKPGHDTREKILNAYPEIDRNWYDTGEGEMIATAKKKDSNKAEEPDMRYQAKAHSDHIVFVHPAQAGYLSTYSQEQINNLPRFNMSHLNLGPGHHAVFLVEGDSMTPRFMPGDYFIGRTLERKDRLELGEVYAIETRDEGVIIKRIVDETIDSIFLMSDNRKVRPYEMLKDDVVRVHKFRSCFGRASGQILQVEGLLEEIRRTFEMAHVQSAKAE